MKFRILTTSQRRRERVFDIGFLMYFIGATLQSVSEAYLLQMGGSLALVWACLSWIFQKKSVPDKWWVHVSAVIPLLVWMYLAVVLFDPSFRR